MCTCALTYTRRIISLVALGPCPEQAQKGSYHEHIFLQQPYDPQDMPEMEVFEVDLIKDTRGLGITIAGYVGGDNSPGTNHIALLMRFV